MRINNNIMALNAHRQLSINQANSGKSMEKLSSGFRINRVVYDAAGLSISEKMRGQIRGLKQASRNAQDGISLIQTAEGALDETHAILQRMRELVVQAGNLGTNEEDDLQAIQDEIDELVEEITGIANRTEFNEKKLLSGAQAADDSLVFQIGANTSQAMSISIATMTATALGTLNASGDAVSFSIASIDVTKMIAATNPVEFDGILGAVDAAIGQISAQRSLLGATQNRLEHTISNLNNAAENLQAAESRIRDLDMAEEIMAFTKNNILQQASTAMLAQANMAPQSVLQLLG